MAVVGLNFDKIDVLKRMLYVSTDWGNIFMLLKETNMNVLTLQLYKCYVDGFTTYKFDMIDPKNGYIRLVKNPENNKELYFMVFPTFNPTIEKHIEFMLSQELVRWGVERDWKLLVDLQ